jgi:hypothetical protein
MSPIKRGRPSIVRPKRSKSMPITRKPLANFDATADLAKFQPLSFKQDLRRCSVSKRAAEAHVPEAHQDYLRLFTRVTDYCLLVRRASRPGWPRYKTSGRRPKRQSLIVGDEQTCYIQPADHGEPLSWRPGLHHGSSNRNGSRCHAFSVGVARAADCLARATYDPPVGGCCVEIQDQPVPMV